MHRESCLPNRFTGPVHQARRKGRNADSGEPTLMLTAWPCSLLNQAAWPTPSWTPRPNVFIANEGDRYRLAASLFRVGVDQSLGRRFLQVRTPLTAQVEPPPNGRARGPLRSSVHSRAVSGGEAPSSRAAASSCCRRRVCSCIALAAAQRAVQESQPDSTMCLGMA